MQVLEDMLLTLQELFMLPSVRLRPMLSIPPMEWVILDMLDTLVMVLLILDMPQLLFILLLHMLPLFIMLLDMESPMLLTLSVFGVAPAAIPAVHGAYAGAGRYVANSAGTVHVAKREAE